MGVGDNLRVMGGSDGWVGGKVWAGSDGRDEREKEEEWPRAGERERERERQRKRERDRDREAATPAVIRFFYTSCDTSGDPLFLL